jgi:hypothetical protein
MKVTDQGSVDLHAIELLAYRRHRSGGLLCVDGDTHELRAGPRKFLHLNGRTDRISGIGIGHGLDDNRCIAADENLALAVMNPDLTRKTTRSGPGGYFNIR